MGRVHKHYDGITWLKMLAFGGVFFVCLLPFLVAAQAKPTAAQPWMNKALSPDKRASLILEQMTLDEKIQLVHGLRTYPLPGVPFSQRTPGSLEGDGFTPAIFRLGFPALQIIGAGAGVTDIGRRWNGRSTQLPSPLAETATWNPKMAYEQGAVIGRETREEGFNVQIGGGINLTREPRDGRTFEYHGEDPLLAGNMVGSELKAIQDQHVVATIKHYAANDQETGRTLVNSILDERSMRESDLLAFEIAIKDSNVGVVMCSYNRVHGDYSCENNYLLNDVLKNDWDFKGWVMSDWGGTHSTVKAALNGLDQEMPAHVFFGEKLKSAVEKGEVPMSRLDNMVFRILRTSFACGIVDYPPAIKPIDAEANRKVAQQIEEQSIVLLKNSGVLPLEASRYKKIAVIGSYSESGVISGGGSSQVTPVGGNTVPAKVWGPGPYGFLSTPIYTPSSPLYSIRIKAPNTFVDYDPGGDVAAAAKLAKLSDIAIVFVHQWTHEGADVPNLSLPDNQDELIRQVAAGNPHTIIVLETGGAVRMPWLNSVEAVLESWYPGSGGGEAIANVLFGYVNPSGRLPITFPKDEADLSHSVIAKPPSGNYKQSGPVSGMQAGFFDVTYTEGLKVGYKWFDAEHKEPLFPFGFGLSYTTFSYSKIASTPENGLHVSFDIKNTGSRAGAEIAQVYLGLPKSTGEPPKRLVAWDRIELRPGETRRVNLLTDRQMMSIFNSDRNDWELVPGEYRLYVGASSRDVRLTKTFQIFGTP